jgi:mRNA interferase YafQ
MKRRVVRTPAFERSLAKFIRANHALQSHVEKTINNMEQDVFARHLRVHKLTGQLKEYRACSCGYDCRIMFTFVHDAQSGEELILLLDVGTHDDLY